MKFSNTKKTSGDATMSSSRLGWSNPEKGRSGEAKMRRARKSAAKLNQSN